MIKLFHILKHLINEDNLENINKVMFSNWIFPSEQELELEYRVEHDLKGKQFFENYDDFRSRIDLSSIEVITPEKDQKIGYRSNTETKEELLGLLKTYRSWGTFRTEQSVQGIYDGFLQNKPMTYPIVLEFKEGSRRVFSGNTRMDISFQLGINPKVLIVQSDNNFYS
jgi:hypothetical protein